ncbi:hypothetical protein JCM1840_006321 [Sporobolomyces johnsonii]
MSSFRRRTTVAPIPGTRPSPYTSLPLLSTGLATLDDLLGGGLPPSSSLLIDADSPTSYSDLLLRYWIAQGLECRQDVLIVASGLEGGPQGVVEALMEVDGGPTARDDAEDDEERKREVEMQDKMKIAFRYEGMRQHQTTVEAPKPSRTGETDTYCSMFDLTTTRQLSSADRARLHLVDVDELRAGAASPSEFYDCLFARIETFVTRDGFLQSTDPSAPRKALRIAISSFGSPSWGPSTPAALYSFLHRLRHLLRLSHASTILTFPSHLYASPSASSSSSPLLTRLSHAADAVLRLTSFAASPTLTAQFPRHAGLLSLPKLPALGTLTAPSAKLSVLRGLGGGGEGRENLLGFRVKRRRFVVEVVSDDPVGGGGEDEAERKRREERRRKVDEANRKEREMTGGRERTDVLLLGARSAVATATGEVEVEKRVRQVRISSEAEEGRPSEEPPARKKGVRIGGVQFAAQDGDAGRRGGVGEEAAGQGTRQEKVSISRMLHQQPELLDF